MTKTALITGIDSFTGKHLAIELESAGFSVAGTVFGDSTASSRRYRLNILDLDALKLAMAQIKPNVVVHLSAISSVSHEDKSQLYLTNVMGTRNLFEALDGASDSLTTVILPSTGQVYGSGSQHLISENSATHPKSDYAISKLAAENLASGIFETSPVTIVRPFNYTGLGQSTKFLIPKIVDHFKRGQRVIELGNLDVARDFLDVRDVARIYVELLQNPAPGQVFNVSSGRAVSIAEVIEMMNEIAGYRIEVVSKPELQRATDIAFLSGDSSKLWNHLGVEYTRPLKETLTWMFEN